jgi:uncharacterized protein (TIGR03089 family)
MAVVRTFTEVLTRQLRADAGRPLITFYDDATGERVELSVTTYANWVAKTASLLADEHGLERGQVVCVDLPLHWLGPVFLGAAWTVGMVVATPEDVDTGGGTLPDAVVCGPATLERWAGHADDVPVLACALLPLGVRFADPLPAGVHDVGVEVWGQPDAFSPWDPPGPGDAATAAAYGSATQAQIWEAAAAGSLVTDGGRLLSEANPASPPGLATFTEPLARGGSLVLVAHAGPGRLEAISAAERVTARFP